MSTIDQIRTINPNKTIHSLDESVFEDYGVAYTQYDVSELKTFMDQHVTIPASTVDQQQPDHSQPESN